MYLEYDTQNAYYNNFRGLTNLVEVRQVVGPGPDAGVQRPELGVLRSAIQACLPLRFLPFCCCHNMKKTRDRQAKQITQVPKTMIIIDFNSFILRTRL